MGEAIILLYLNGLGAALMVMAILIFVNGLDDLFIDISFHARSIYHYIKVRQQRPFPALSKIGMIPEAPVALVIPAWQEADVIGRMLQNACETIRYQNFRIFVGAYANDAPTRTAVAAIAKFYDNISLVVVPRQGPTNKADCLNCIYDAIRLYEQTSGASFSIFVMHDAEDVVHPYELKLFNYLIPHKDMVQLPVLPLERGWNHFTAGHYLDEFAESHTKDLYVREILIGHVPCAGVGCAFSRRAMLGVAAANQGKPFNINSVTEDYDFALRMALLGYRQIFVRFGIPFGPENQIEYVATREYFPTHFGAAVRQKSRWLVGIVLQGWKEIGWRGSWRFKYALLRDRKAIAVAFMTMFSYVIAANITAVWLYGRLAGFPLILGELHLAPWLTSLLVVNGLLLVNRVAHRWYFVFRYYGAIQACWSFPRQVWGNVINFFAAARAIRVFALAAFEKADVKWEKTAHEFPTHAELRPFHQRLGNLLMRRRL